MGPRRRSSGERLTLAGALTRFGVALVLVHATYTPEGWSYPHWITHPRPAGAEPASWLETPAL
jgi:hypothetical protein